MGGESCTVLRLRLMLKLAMPHMYFFSGKCIFQKWTLVKGYRALKLVEKNLSFSLLKHKQKVGVNEIFCMILTKLLSIYQYTLFFQPNLYYNKSSRKSRIRENRISQPMRIVAPIFLFQLASKKGLIAFFCGQKYG